MIYFISDTHFNHKNIIEYCNRPFKDIDEMNEAIINNWNNQVKDEDIVYHLGDVAISSESTLKDIIPRLTGKKYLIRGNHDTKSVSFFESCGFIVLKNAPIRLDEYKLILSHVPLPDTMIPKGYINIHGHIHNKKLEEMEEYDKRLYTPALHFNVSADVVNFTPISLNKILDRINND